MLISVRTRTNTRFSTNIDTYSRLTAFQTQQMSATTILHTTCQLTKVWNVLWMRTLHKVECESNVPKIGNRGDKMSNILMVCINANMLNTDADHKWISIKYLVLGLCFVSYTNQFLECQNHILPPTRYSCNSPSPAAFPLSPLSLSLPQFIAPYIALHHKLCTVYFRCVDNFKNGHDVCEILCVVGCCCLLLPTQKTSRVPHTVRSNPPHTIGNANDDHKIQM